MDQSATFARHFARLVSLLQHDTENVVEQKMALRALVTVSRAGVVTLVARDGRLFANTETVAAALTGVSDVTERMAAHSVLGIKVGQASKASDLVGLARILIETATGGDGGTAIRQKLASAGQKAIDLATLPATVAASAAVAPPPPSLSDAPTVVAAQGAASLISQLAAADVSALSPMDLLAALDSANGADAMAKTLDELALIAEHAMRIGKTATVGEVFHGIVTRESGIRDAEAKRAYAAALRKMTKPALLRAVASLIPKRPEGRQQYFEVLERLGDDGADAVIEQVNQAPTTQDRKALFEVLRELRAAVPALKRMLGDSRWFVARGAADLLGEMVATSAEDALVAALRHTDDRVRRAATNALLKLGTPDAMKGIYEAVNDKSPEVRIQATAAIATKRDAKTSHTLIRAIEDEQDGDVQLAMIAALGKIASPDAVQKLVRMAEPEGRLFRKKPTAFRVAAVQALAEARTPAALNALRELAGDKEREVRDTAARGLAHAAR